MELWDEIAIIHLATLAAWFRLVWDLECVTRVVFFEGGVVVGGGAPEVAK